MKKRKIYGLAIVVLALSITLGSFLATENPYYDIYKKYEASLNTQEQMQLEDFVSYMYYGMPDKYVEFIRANTVSKKVVEIILSEGYYTEYYQEFKDAGLVSAEYELPKNSAKAASNDNAPAATPEPVTTEKCTEKVMWATGTVNVRENGSTSYKKVGSLKAGEQVTVTGTDSTGWYEIKMQDGTVGHVSDKYLTEDDPSVSVAPIENSEDTTPQTEPTEETTESAEPTEETATTPDVEEAEAVEAEEVDKTVENSTEPAIEEPSADPEPSATTVPEEDTEDLNADPSPAADVQEEKTNDGLKTIILVSVVGLVVLGLGICTVTYLYRKKKNKK